jgi:hypothetical protein
MSASTSGVIFYFNSFDVRDYKSFIRKIFGLKVEGAQQLRKVNFFHLEKIFPALVFNRLKNVETTLKQTLIIESFANNHRTKRPALNESRV